MGDFGIANLIVDSRSIAVGHSGCKYSLAVTGTIGCMAPEYAQTVHASTFNLGMFMILEYYSWR